jgi:hypothetical protein
LWPLSSDQNQQGERLAHDQWYFLLGSALGTIVYLPNVLADYRQHGSNTYGVSWYKIHAPQLTELWHATHERNERLVAAEGRARMFREANESLAGPLRGRAIEAARWYDQLATLVRSRAELYDAKGWAERASKLKGLVRAGAYGSNAKEFSHLSLAMDASVGVSGIFPLIESITRRIAGR